MSISFSLIRTDDDDQFVTVFIPGRDPLSAPSSHANFAAIVAACGASMRGEDVCGDEVADLFDVAAAVARKFERLSERVTVGPDGVMLDGDPVHGTLQTQILDFLDAGEDFAPLVNFYEKLTTNPLGDVQQGLYGWITGQTANGGKLSITSDGDVLGYKSVQSATPEWRTEHATVYRPSRRGTGTVNGIDVAANQYIEQVPGDVVEMPRSKVLHAPSAACGDGLHVGTEQYARTFYGGDTMMLVRFSPRDIVSLPSSAATWKLRVCRYAVVAIVDKCIDALVYDAPEEPGAHGGDRVADAVGFARGDRVVDDEGDEGVVDDINGDLLFVDYDEYGSAWVEGRDLARVHGSGGATSYSAKGRGRNPAQDDKGRFSAGRPNSQRDPNTGRFA